MKGCRSFFMNMLMSHVFLSTTVKGQRKIFSCGYPCEGQTMTCNYTNMLAERGTKTLQIAMCVKRRERERSLRWLGQPLSQVAHLGVKLERVGQGRSNRRAAGCFFGRDQTGKWHMQSGRLRHTFWQPCV